MSEEKIKPLSDEEFTFVPDKAGPEVWIILGVLGLIAVALMATNALISGGFDPWWITFPAIAAVGFGMMMPTIRKMQRKEKYQKYLRRQSRDNLSEALMSDLDAESLAMIREALNSDSAPSEDDDVRSSRRSAAMSATMSSDRFDSGSSSESSSGFGGGGFSGGDSGGSCGGGGCD